MKDMLKIDMHVHSKGISLCSLASCEEIIEHKLQLGYDGAVLTNHCQAHYYPAELHAEYIERVIEEFERGLGYARKRNFRFYLGLEVTLSKPFYSDWLLYGVTEEILRRSPCFYQLTQKELFTFCEENGVVLVQAHPYRGNRSYCSDMHPGDPAYLHGLEINCTPGDLETAERIVEFCEREGKIVTCGTDYHHLDRTYFGGTYLPSAIETARDIGEYLKKTNKTQVFLGEKTLEIPVNKRDCGIFEKN